MHKQLLSTRLLVAIMLMLGLFVMPLSSINVQAQEGEGDQVDQQAQECPDVDGDGLPDEGCEQPAGEETEEPAAEPTDEPTDEPTAEPTDEPTDEPAAEPTDEPTDEPTAEPTDEPTEEPTDEPTAEPTDEATAEPTDEATAEPTEESTDEPTVEPTDEPPAEPTEEPTEEVLLEESSAVTTQGTFASSTVFAAQNPSTSASVDIGVTIYNTSGGVAFNDSQTVSPGYAYLLDQATQTLTGFTQGSAVVQSGDNVGVTTLIKSTASGATPRFDTYNGITSSDVGQTLTFPQFIRNVVSLGDRFNTTLAIQNTSSGQATISVQYVAVFAGTTQTQNYNIPANASVYINSEDLTGLGTFFGFARVTQPGTTNPARDLAGIGFIRTGETTVKGSMFTFAGAASGVTSADGVVPTATVFKNVFSSADGCTYSSAKTVANIGSGTASVRFTTAGIQETVNIPDFASNPGGSYIVYDHRFSPASLPSGTLGSGTMQVLSGEVVSIDNLRGAPCNNANNLPVSSVPVVAASGTKLLVPMVMKQDTSGTFGSGFTWASAVVVSSNTASAGITVTYYPYNGSSSVSYSTNLVNGQKNIDQRFDTNLNSAKPGQFQGSMLIESSSQIAATINLRGLGGAADAVGSYLAQPR